MASSHTFPDMPPPPPRPPTVPAAMPCSLPRDLDGEDGWEFFPNQKEKEGHFDVMYCRGKPGRTTSPWTFQVLDCVRVSEDRRQLVAQWAFDAWLVTYWMGILEQGAAPERMQEKIPQSNLTVEECRRLLQKLKEFVRDYKGARYQGHKFMRFQNHVKTICENLKIQPPRPWVGEESLQPQIIDEGTAESTWEYLNNWACFNRLRGVGGTGMFLVTLSHNEKPVAMMNVLQHHQMVGGVDYHVYQYHNCTFHPLYLIDVLLARPVPIADEASIVKIMRSFAMDVFRCSAAPTLTFIGGSRGVQVGLSVEEDMRNQPESLRARELTKEEVDALAKAYGAFVYSNPNCRHIRPDVVLLSVDDDFRGHWRRALSEVSEGNL